MSWPTFKLALKLTVAGVIGGPLILAVLLAPGALLVLHGHDVIACALYAFAITFAFIYKVVEDTGGA